MPGIRIRRPGPRRGLLRSQFGRFVGFADTFGIDRPQLDKELLALQRRFRKVAARDYFTAPARQAAAAAIDRCLAYRQGISRRLAPVTDLEALSTRSR